LYVIHFEVGYNIAHKQNKNCTAAVKYLKPTSSNQNYDTIYNIMYLKYTNYWVDGVRFGIKIRLSKSCIKNNDLLSSR